MTKKRKDPKRVAAGYKAAATRRKRVAERSAAAKKGHRTRAKNLARATRTRRKGQPKKRKGPPRGRAPARKKKATPKVVVRETWEVTISYHEKDGPRLDVTVRVDAPGDWRREHVEAAVKRAVHGGSVDRADIQWIDWQRFGKRGNAVTGLRTGNGDNLAEMRRPLLAGRWRTERIAE